MTSFVEKQSMCCGLGEFHGLNERSYTGPVEALAVVARAAENFEPEPGLSGGDSFAHVIFTQIPIDGRYARLDAVKRAVEQLGLGQWVATRPSLNPNSGNKVKMGIYTPNKQALLRWWRAQEELPYNLRPERRGGFNALTWNW